MYVLEKPVFLEFERIEGEGDFRVNRRVNLIVVCAGITIIACVAWRFWLGALSNKGGRGQRNREEIGAEAT